MHGCVCHSVRHARLVLEEVASAETELREKGEKAQAGWYAHEHRAGALAILRGTCDMSISTPAPASLTLFRVNHLLADLGCNGWADVYYLACSSIPLRQ